VRTPGARGNIRRGGGAVAALALAAMAAGCTHGGDTTASVMRPAGGTTVAFESVDGPPPAIFEQLVTTLAEEANARQLPVVSRQGSPTYRVRAYLAVHVVRKQPQVGWVWDVYDVNQRRAFRIAGEEVGARAGRDAWASADGEVLKRIARRGMDQLAGFVGTPSARPPSQPEDQSGILLAGPASSPPALIPASANVPLPPRRPQRSAAASPTAYDAITLAIAVR
jgi:hypothetical protein